MSYQVAVVAPRVAADDERAWNRLDEMIGQEGPIPHVFVDLHNRLTAKFPCICDLPEAQADDGVWSDGPLRNNLGHRVTVLGIVPECVDEVLPFLIETANDLGLFVFDGSTGKIHRPSKKMPRGATRIADLSHFGAVEPLPPAFWFSAIKIGLALIAIFCLAVFLVFEPLAQKGLNASFSEIYPGLCALGAGLGLIFLLWFMGREEEWPE